MFLRASLTRPLIKNPPPPPTEANALRSLITKKFNLDQFCNHEEWFKILQRLWIPERVERCHKFCSLLTQT